MPSSLPKMSAPMEGPSSPKKKANPMMVVLLIVGVLCVSFCVGGGFLLAYLAPRFQAVRQRSQATTCINNLKTIGTSIGLYAADSDDHLPIASRWMDELRPFEQFGTQMRCPAVRGRQRGKFGYAFNASLSGKQRSKSDSKASIVFDSTLMDKNAFAGLETLPKPGRHSEKQKKFDNVLLLDGSVHSQAN